MEEAKGSERSCARTGTPLNLYMNPTAATDKGPIPAWDATEMPVATRELNGLVASGQR